jgi:nucleoid-associated protein YgaU
MSTRRLLGTAAVMAVVAVGLAALTPSLPAMTRAVTTAQETADTLGLDVLISSAAGLLAWAVWAWGALGLMLTGASALPGIAGGAARMVLQVVLPAGARRSAALLLGLGLGVATPLAGAALPGLAPPAAAADSAGERVPDWPAPPADAAAVPDWPTGTPSPAASPAASRAASPAVGERVVLRGDCLWHIAAASLLGQLGRLPTDGEVVTAVHAWWSANADVIGPDPDVLLPGQVLRPPGPP